MIHFFRRIRRDLLTNSKFFKYLKYAVGEIILVVLGILIALQINNWNEQKKNKKLEKEILHELKTALESDLADLRVNIQWQEKILNSQEVILNWMTGVQISVDSINYHFSKACAGSTFTSNQGPYDNLKQIGMRRISNDSLRLQIMTMYDMTFQLYKVAETFYYELQMDFWKNHNSVHFKSINPLGETQPRNMNELREDMTYYYHLETFRNYNALFIESNIKLTYKKVERTIKMIEEELK